MCGIAGIFNFRDGAPADAERLRAMTGRLRHRGPDDEGFLLDGALGLGMRRLSIIDVAGGAQPIGSEDGAVQIVFNGEIYNHRALRRDLEARGHRFRSRADTEVIVHGYEEDGPEILRRLNGIFAFALWDRPRRRLLLARDRLGVKPLYYAETPSGIAFASELFALLEAPGIRRDLDAVALCQYFTWEYIPSPRTPLAAVRKLAPAERLSVTALGPRASTWWRLERRPEIARAEEAFEGLRWHLDRAVRLQMEADVPVGAFLSGGLDSSAVVATLAAARARPPRTFSAGFAEAEFDESRRARAVAESVGVPHETTLVGRVTPDMIGKAAACLDEPFADASIVPTFMVAALARRSVKVALSGDGGDELFGGYDHYKADRAARAWSRLPEALRRLAAAGPLPRRARGVLRRLEGGLALPPDLEHARFMVRSTAALHGDLLREAGVPARGDWARPILDAFRASPFPRGVARQGDVDVRTYLADDILYKVDRASMAHGLEARVPYLDHELVEFAFRVPDRFKVRGLEGKWILRQAFRGRLPAAVLRRRKQGFCAPIAAWLRGPLGGMVRDLLSPSRVERQGLFQSRAVGDLIEGHLAQGADHARALWALVMFQLWSDRLAQCAQPEGCARRPALPITASSFAQG